MATKKSKNRPGAQTSAHMALLNEKIESLKHANASEMKDLRLHMDKCINRVFDKVDETKERLFKLEAEVPHVDFQRTLCPNTRELVSVLSWIEEHKKDYKELRTYFDGKFKQLEETKKQQRNRFYTLLGAVAASAVSALVHLLGE